MVRTVSYVLKVQSVEGKTYLLRYDEETDEWTLQSGFDGDQLLTRPGIELVTVDPATAKKAEQLIESCEHCHPDDADIPFDWILADMTGKRGAYEFMLSEPARCPNCKHSITEKTLIEPKQNDTSLEDATSLEYGLRVNQVILIADASLTDHIYD